MNIELFEKIKEQIRKEPTSFNMCHWFKPKTPAQTPCGTSACIAGWACVMALGERPQQQWNWFHTWQESGAALLGLNGKSSLSLFLHANWPIRFRNRYEKALAAGDMAKAGEVACEVIDNFIATEGWTLTDEEAQAKRDQEITTEQIPIQIPARNLA